jgi:hypothetical protein
VAAATMGNFTEQMNVKQKEKSAPDRKFFLSGALKHSHASPAQAMNCSQHDIISLSKYTTR